MPSWDLNFSVVIQYPTNIPLEETIAISANTIFEITEKVEGLPKIEFKKLARKESYFISNKNFYKQVDGVTMCSLLGPTLGNVYRTRKAWYTLKRIDYKTVHLTLSHITIGGMLMISLFYLPHQNI